MRSKVRIELLGGPLDGERRTVSGGMTRFVTCAPASIASHVYVKGEDGRFRYEGCVGPAKATPPADDYHNGDD